jgi:putative Mn2+ efflux pump MntP
MYEVLFLALALSMDAFAVSICFGPKQATKTKFLAAKVAIYFGVFHGTMPLLGFWGGQGVFSWIEDYAHWIAFSLLVIVGVKMIYESFTEAPEKSSSCITHKVLIILAFATSIDAMATGFTLTLIKVNPYLACAIVGSTTFIFSWFGVWAGTKSNKWKNYKTEVLGGLVLIFIGFKILLY